MSFRNIPKKNTKNQGYSVLWHDYIRHGNIELTVNNKLKAKTSLKSRRFISSENAATLSIFILLSSRNNIHSLDKRNIAYIF
jgi:hypothetical protein